MRLTPWRFFRKAGIKFFYDHSPFAASIISYPGGFEALDKIYMNRPETLLDKILLNLKACEGTRQRHHIYQHLLHSYMGKIPDHQNNICVLDLGSGAGRALLQVAYERICISPCLAQNINITLVDKDRNALKEARVFSDELGLSRIVMTKCYNAKRISEIELQEKYSIVGTHGLLDYFQDDEAVRFFQDISDILSPSGKLITTNMAPHNDWIARWLMEYFGNWRLVYRTPGELESLVEKSERYENIKKLILPMRFHTIVTAIKRG